MSPNFRLGRQGRGHHWQNECGALAAAVVDPSAFLDNWWHSQDGITESGGLVSSWVDLIASLAITGAVGRRPAIAASADYGNQLALTFDGINDVLEAAIGVSVLGLRPWSAWWVGNRTAGGAQLYLFGNYFNTPAGYQFMRTTPTAYSFESNTGGIQFSGVLTPQTPHSHLLTYDVGAVNNVKLYVDGALAWTASNNGPTTGTTTQFSLGGIAGGGTTSPYRFTDFGVNRGTILTLADAQALHVYAQAEYGLP